MKTLFLDTNILIDFLADRPPFGKYAISLFDLAEKEEVKLYTSTHSFATTYYLLKKHFDEKELRKLLTGLLEFIELIAVDLSIIKKSLRSTRRDFEDAIQIAAANSIPEMDFIVTRNLKDFKDAGIEVLPPDEVLRLL